MGEAKFFTTLSETSSGKRRRHLETGASHETYQRPRRHGSDGPHPLELKDAGFGVRKPAKKEMRRY